MSTIPVIELTGTPFERGVAHGRALGDLIAEFVESVTSVHQMNNGFIRVDKDRLETFCMKNLGFLEKFSPELVEEMRGIAEGAGVTFKEILYLNSFLELEDLRAPGIGGTVLPDGLWGCTTFNVTRDAGEGGRAYIGQTYDMEKYYERFLCLLRIVPEQGPAQLVISFAGILGLVGLNAAGVGAVINKVTATDARPGVVYPFIMRRALSSERIGDALGAAIFSPRAGGINYQFAGSGVAFCAETSAAYYQLLDIDGSIAHTNHFVGRDMRRFETPNWLSHGGSMVRKQVADNFLKRHRGALNPEKLKELTRDHTNYPRCICAHGFPGEDPKTAFHTVFAVIMDPEAGWLELCSGNPCENTYERHVL
ncbi:peptidase C45 acyl-coenzyme A:6-aminopenicillanic acid acyl-transferase [Pseudodesulfovibrio mercurii]|uniref:Peptidase C45 acyl-coenzyme A:6-aminopenicillanic acid acyl-transferase n=1 Tax=Pseudodesulfovibrio mercurii TaxID=641491 RepID=F0JDE5_9BACT|nr:acyl-CoA--6-aminopenicillanic acid acyl-transferase [Pseudodesulfovibrio mercurii]EGB13314.1 peptidase C45 acyl-coenzyme A:6-aminopenicillanic acid acyl-transferase [Pseudodesulfovibrio mercurii]